MIVALLFFLLPPAPPVIVEGLHLPVSFVSQTKTFVSVSSTTSVSKLGLSNYKDYTAQSSTMIEKQNLLRLLSQLKPNQPTSKSFTKDILQTVTELEAKCPLLSLATINNKENDVSVADSLLKEINGNWELIWTAQDKLRDEAISFTSWINPLENQSYSNNPFVNINNDDGDEEKAEQDYSQKQGRANPILPQKLQNILEKFGIITNDNDEMLLSTTNNMNTRIVDTNNVDKNAFVKSSQTIDVRKGRIRNVVSVLLTNPLSFTGRRATNYNRQKNSVRASLTVDIKFKSNELDPRKVDVKFDECRINIPNSPLDIRIPLGIVGPTGWLRTTYCDDTIRISRGHKGSVFILKRTSRKR